MNLKKVLKEVDFSVPKEEMKIIESGAKEIYEKISKELKKRKMKAQVFFGGSFAKETMIQKREQDIDLFIRFEKNEFLDMKLERIVKSCFKNYEKMHGSRDYFRIKWKDNVFFEIIPVLKISNQKKAENVTDLSYFHVKYVKSKTKKIKEEIKKAKRFCKAIEVYGAESYIQGFSGYALECLVIYYGSFEKMLKLLIEVKEKLVIDPAKHFKNKKSILIELNQSKTLGPVVLVDPTFKERNVLAALSEETFQDFRKEARKFLRKPNKKYFEIQDFSVEKFKKKAGIGKDFIELEIKTDRQEGDVAGTKLKKFYNLLIGEISKKYKISSKKFVYYGEKKASIYLIVSKKKEILLEGPPLKMTSSIQKFKKQHKKGKGKFVKKEGKIYFKTIVKKDINKFLTAWFKDNKTTMVDMGIVGVDLV